MPKSPPLTVQDQLTDSRWTANPMPYVDGLSSAVLKHPYTVLCDPADDTIYVTSFTLNHVVRLRMTSRTAAQYKVCILRLCLRLHLHPHRILSPST